MEIPDGSFNQVKAMLDMEPVAASDKPPGETSKSEEVGILTAHDYCSLLIVVVVLCSRLMTLGFSLLVPCQNKVLVKRFMESVLQKSTKLKSLLKDLKDNYTPESIRSQLY